MTDDILLTVQEEPDITLEYVEAAIKPETVGHAVPKRQAQTVYPASGTVFGSVEIDPIPDPILQNTSITPTKQKQTVTADSGFDGLGTVEVEPIPSEYIIPQGKTIIPQNGTFNVSQYEEVEVSVPVILNAPRFEVKKKRVTFVKSTGSLSGALGYLCRLTKTSNTVTGLCFYVVEKQNEWADGDYLWGETGYEPYGQNGGTWKSRYSKYNGATFVESSGANGNVNGTINAGDVVDIFYVEILPTRSLMSSLLRGDGQQVLQPIDAADPVYPESDESGDI